MATPEASAEQRLAWAAEVRELLKGLSFVEATAAVLGAVRHALTLEALVAMDLTVTYPPEQEGGEPRTHLLATDWPLQPPDDIVVAAAIVRFYRAEPWWEWGHQGVLCPEVFEAVEAAYQRQEPVGQ